jgi:hypothetical protein
LKESYRLVLAKDLPDEEYDLIRKEVRRNEKKLAEFKRELSGYFRASFTDAASVRPLVSEALAAWRERHRLHHHATLCIAAYWFLVAERNRFSPSARTGHLGFVVPRSVPNFRPRVAESDPSGIVRTPSRRYAWGWRARKYGSSFNTLVAASHRAERRRRNLFPRCTSRDATHLRASRPG